MNATVIPTVEQSSPPKVVLPPSGYNALCITNLLLCLLSMILCFVLIIAMVSPLLSPKRRKHYSTYNLYLAYLAIPDLSADAFIVHIILAHENWIANDTENNNDNNNDSENDMLWMFDHPLDHSLYILTATSNMYLNAFLTYEIFCLLKNTNMLKRHSPPTIAKVTKQAMISYGFGIIVFLVDYGIHDRFGKNFLYKFLTLVYCSIIPLTVLIVLCGMIHWEGLIPSTGSLYERRLKILILYFARIIFCDILFWLPASIIYFVSWNEEEVNPKKIIAYNICIVFSVSQSIVNFGCSLRKPDALKLIVDLLKFAQCRDCVGDNMDDEEAEGDETTISFRCRDPYLRATHQETNLVSKAAKDNSNRRSSMASATERASLFSQKFLPGKNIAVGEATNNDANTKSHVNDDDVVAVEDDPSESNNNETPNVPSGP